MLDMIDTGRAAMPFGMTTKAPDTEGQTDPGTTAETKAPDATAPVALQMTKSALETLITDTVGAVVAESMKGLAAPQPGAAQTIVSPAITKSLREPSSNFGGFMGVLVKAKGNTYLAGQVARDMYGADHAITKALNESTSGEGAELVPTIVADEIIPALRAASVIRRFGPRIVPNPSGSLLVNRIATPAQGTWVGEGQIANATQPVLDTVTLTWRKLHVKVPWTKELAMHSAPDVESAITADVVASVATSEDAAFIRGAAGGMNPVGLRYQMGAGQVIAANGTVNSDTVEEDLLKLVNAVEGANQPITNETAVWLLSTRSKNWLLKLRDANGNLIYPELREATPRLHGYRVGVTNNIPSNLGGGSNETEIYFGHMPGIMIADGTGLEVGVLENVAYTDSGGNLRSGVDTDELLVKAVTRTDMALRYTTSWACLTGVTWGG